MKCITTYTNYFIGIQQSIQFKSMIIPYRRREIVVNHMQSMLCLLTRVATVRIDDEINRMVNTQGDCSKVCYSDKNKYVHAID